MCIPSWGRSVKNNPGYSLDVATQGRDRPFLQSIDMNAQVLAERINKLGFTPLALSEPTERVDGMIVFTKGVHIQVPLRGEEPNVVRESSKGEFEFYDAQKSMARLIDDLKSALQDEKAMAPTRNSD